MTNYTLTGEKSAPFDLQEEYKREVEPLLLQINEACFRLGISFVASFVVAGDEERIYARTSYNSAENRFIPLYYDLYCDVRDGGG